MASIRSLLDSLPALPPADFSQFGPVETVPIKKWQRIGGRLLARNWVSIPHVTHHDELDVTELDAARRRHNERPGVQKLTLVPLLASASTELLKRHPRFNASLDETGNQLVLKKYFNIGIAVDTDDGLLVPVIRDCDTKDLSSIAKEIAILSAKAKETGLPITDMSGGCFTISSLGHIGGTGFTPIINAPELAILGVCRLRTRLVMDDEGKLSNRRVVPVSLSYDHRVLNGVDAAHFTRDLQLVLDSSAFRERLE